MKNKNPLISIFDINQLTDISSITSRLNAQVLAYAAQFTSEKRRRQFLVGRWLLSEMLSQWCYIEQLPEIITRTNGKPCFKEVGYPDFNISHSGDLVMVALSYAGEVGLDLEVNHHRDKFLQIARHHFGYSEYIYLQSLSISEQSLFFWRFWTIRESILKLNALTVWHMKEIQIFPETNTIQMVDKKRLTSISFVNKHYTWALSSHKQNLSKIEQLFFHPEKKLFVPAKANGIYLKFSS